MMPLTVPLQWLDHGRGLDLPAHATQGSAGLDLRAALGEPVTLVPMDRALIPTGFAMALPTGYEAQIRPRSGLAVKHGLTVLNTPGTIDSDYRGEVKILLINFGAVPFTIERGMRIAQMVVTDYIRTAFTEGQDLTASDRQSGGFGSTGV